MDVARPARRAERHEAGHASSGVACVRVVHSSAFTHRSSRSSSCCVDRDAVLLPLLPRRPGLGHHRRGVGAPRVHAVLAVAPARRALPPSSTTSYSDRNATTAAAAALALRHDGGAGVGRRRHRRRLPIVQHDGEPRGARVLCGAEEAAAQIRRSRRRRRSERRVQRVPRHAVQRGAARDVRPAPRAVGRPRVGGGVGDDRRRRGERAQVGGGVPRGRAAAAAAADPPRAAARPVPGEPAAQPRGRRRHRLPLLRVRRRPVAERRPPRRFTRAAAQLHDAIEARDGRPRVRGVLVGVPPARRRRRAADARRAKALRTPAVGQLVALRRVQTLDGDAHVDLVPTVVEDRRRRRPVQGAVLRLDPLRAVRPRAEGRRDARL